MVYRQLPAFQARIVSGDSPPALPKEEPRALLLRKWHTGCGQMPAAVMHSFHGFSVHKFT